MHPSLRDALASAVANDPSNVELRLHVVSQLRDGSDLDAARELIRDGLSTTPADVQLLTCAHDVALAAGNTDEAAGYDALLAALGATGAGTHAAEERLTSERPPVATAEEPEEPRATATEQPAAPPSPPWVTDDAPAAPAAPLVHGSVELVPDSVDELLQLWDGTEAAEQPAVGQLSRFDVTLADVGGMHAVKQRLNSSFLVPMRNPEMQRAFGKSMKGGLLLWGPPGCGKTYIAKAVAGELGANFYHVGLSDVLDMYIGSSERNISALFDIARRNSPCVLFLDEVDALGQKRTSRGTGAMRGVVNQLLQEMDGAVSNNDGVFILAATNHPWDIDSALLRPGRLDRMLLVLPPDQAARESILDLHLRGRPIDGLRVDQLAAETNGLTGADLALLCEQATEYAMLDSIESGEVRPISMADLRRASAEVNPSYGPWCDAAKNYALFNNDSGRYDELLQWLNSRRK